MTCAIIASATISCNPPKLWWPKFFLPLGPPRESPSLRIHQICWTFWCGLGRIIHQRRKTPRPRETDGAPQAGPWPGENIARSQVSRKASRTWTIPMDGHFTDVFSVFCRRGPRRSFSSLGIPRAESPRAFNSTGPSARRLPLNVRKHRKREGRPNDRSLYHFRGLTKGFA